MALKGHVDGLEGCYVLGWAYSNDAPAGCLVCIEDGDGQLIASGEATVARSDLVKLGFGNSSFRISLGNIHETKALRIFVKGTELAGSPIQVGPGRYDGQVWVANGFVRGWISERVSKFDPPVVRVIDQDDEVVCEVQSEFSDPDLDPFFSPARFQVPLANAYFGRRDMELRAFVNDVQFARTNCSLTLRGCLDHVSAQRCAGWLNSPEAPHRKLEIEIYRNGEIVATTQADRPRPDLRSKFTNSWQCGFEALLPPSEQLRAELTSLSLRLRGSETELFDGPYLISDVPASIAAARKAATLTLDASGRLSAAERSLVQSALADYINQRRRSTDLVTYARSDAVETASATAPPGLALYADSPAPAESTWPRLNIVIPVYRDAKITRTCIDSVLAHRSTATDRLILVNDCSPDADMADVLQRYATGAKNVTLLTNETNLGFVKSVNRALKFCSHGAIVLLNSDARVFAGGFDEMWNVAKSSPDIGTVTAMSNNATIFSYPHPGLVDIELADASWEQLAAIAHKENTGTAVDVPTAHGFCMLITRRALQRVGVFDEAFGRGYGEENDFCARAADIGFRNVAAGGVFVEHRESVSFAEEKLTLRKANMDRIKQMYPEYMSFIEDFERHDPLRGVRWPLDAARLKSASDKGRSFVMVIQHYMGGGTKKAASDIEAAAGIEETDKITLLCREDGYLEITATDPVIRAVFAADEVEPIFRLLNAAAPRLVVVHQVIGFSAAFIRRLAHWVRDYRSTFYAHDYYALCPRVTLIDAAQRFCNVASAEVCDRCVALGAEHEASRLYKLPLIEHRAMFAEFLRGFTHVVAPSESAAGYLQRQFSDLAVEVLPHPDSQIEFAAAPRRGNDNEIVLMGAIGAHKGSAILLDLARRARMTRPRLSFRVIGYTNIDAKLLDVGNVTITGSYEQADLPRLMGETTGRLALFLHNWPETYSYALSEAVAHGFIPLVPDIGAPADRVRQAGFGVVFPFPPDVEHILQLLDKIATGGQKLWNQGGSPANFRAAPATLTRLQELVSESADVSSPATTRVRLAVGAGSGSR